MLARARLLGIVLHRHGLHLALGIVGDDYLDRVHHGHHSGGDAVEIVAHGVLQQAHRVESLVFGIADGVDEVAYRLRCVAAAAHTRDGGHAGVIPAVDQPLLDQREQLALAHHGIGEVEAVELDLARTVRLVGQLVDKVVVERAVRHKFQRAYRVGHALEVVALSVCEVVHRIYVPAGAGAVVRMVDDAVHDGVAEVHVARRHVYLGAQHMRPFGKLARVHALKQVEILLDRTVAVGAVLARLGRGTFLGGNLLRCLVVDICFALLDQADSQVVQLGEVVGGVVQAIAPVKSQPVDILHDRVDILRILLDRVGVVEAQVAGATELLGDAEVHAYRLGMADVKIAIGLGRETGIETSAILAGLQVGQYFLFYKTQPAGSFFGFLDFGHKYRFMFKPQRYKKTFYLALPRRISDVDWKSPEIFAARPRTRSAGFRVIILLS